MKKSLFTLFTSLIVCGLLLVGSANAMTYTVNGNKSNIAIPAETQGGSTIKRCYNCETETISPNYNSTGTTCEIETISNTDYIKCTHTYSSAGEHQVTFTANNTSFDNLYLNDANITSISNFSSISKIANLYLYNNPNFSLPSNFSNIRITNLYLDNDTLSEFGTSLPNSNQKISLTHNSYTTIVPNIRKLRDSYVIKLSNSISYPSNNSYDKEIDLSNNNINFIGLTGIGNDNGYYQLDNPDNYTSSSYPFTEATTYEFEWFAYSYNTSPLYYNWGIYKNGITDPIAHPDTLTSSQSVTHDQALAPGDYTFKVWYTDNTSTSHEASINFDVSYYLGINFTNQTTVNEGGSIEPQDAIKFEWGKDGSYPENFIGSPKFEFELIDTDSSNIVLNGKSYETSYTLTEETKSNLENGKTYAFNVYILDTEGNRIQADANYIFKCDEAYYCYYPDSYYTGPIYASRSFTVNIPEIPIPTIQIDRPNNQETESITYFSWTPTIPDGNDFTNYTWSIKDNNNTTITGGIITNQSKTGLSIHNLDNGTYTFYIELNYSRDGNLQGPVTDTRYTNGTKSFTVAKTYPSIKINRPLDNETGAVTYFSWTPTMTPGFTFKNYEWTISKNGTTIISRQYTNIEQTSYETGGLNNGEYTFNIKMNYTQDSNNQSGYAIDRDYALNGGSKTFTISKPNTLNITSPANNGAVLTESENTFSRNGATSNTFIKYTYTLTGNDYSTGGSFDRINQNSFTIRNLRDGNYTLKVIMETNNGNETDIRTFRVNTSAGVNLTITSPNKTRYTGNYIKTVPMNFTWNGGGSTLISRYSYKLTNTATSEIKAQGYVDKNAGGSYSIPVSPLSLPSGIYKFEVTMLDSEDNPIIPTESYTFNIVIPSYLEILSPSSGQLNIKNVNFTWSGFAEFEDHYKYEVNRVDNQGNIISTIKSGNNIPLSTKSFSLQNLHNGKYTFTIKLMNSSNNEIISKSRTFRIPDDLDLVLDISDGNSSVTTLRSKKGIFSWGGRSEDFAGYSYSIQGTTFKNESYLYTGTSEGVTTGSITLSNLSTGKYRFHVKMLNASGGIITGKYIDFNVVIPASLKITSPTSGSTVSSSNATFKWDGYSDVITRYEYSLTNSGGYSNNGFTTASSFNRNDLTNGNYTLVVRLASGTNIVAQDTVHFTVSIPKKTSGGGGGGSSSKSHPTNDLSVSITNDEPTTNERVEVVVDVNDKYTGKVDFTKMQYYSFDEEKRVDIPVTSKNYVKDYSDDAKLGYVKFDSSDDGEKNLSEFLKFSQPGNYRIHVEDKDGYNDYVQFYVGKGNNKTQLTTSKEPQDEDEYYIARSCKKYKIEYLNNLGVYTSPNLKKDEYFVSKDYFKRYIDSKNKRTDGCPTNVGWITTTYKDSSNSSDRYTAPNGKVYFINGQNGIYSSTELDKELNGAKKFSTINDLKYFIRDRNPFISMAKLGPITTK